MTQHLSQVPVEIDSYFQARPGLEMSRDIGRFSNHPIITAEFKDRWLRTSYRKHVTCSWLRKLQSEGVTDVAVTLHGVTAEFNIKSVLRAQRKANPPEMRIGAERYRD